MRKNKDFSVAFLKVCINGMVNNEEVLLNSGRLKTLLNFKYIWFAWNMVTSDSQMDVVDILSKRDVQFLFAEYWKPGLCPAAFLNKDEEQWK